jgi:hypothetical protein
MQNTALWLLVSVAATLTPGNATFLTFDGFPSANSAISNYGSNMTAACSGSGQPGCVLQGNGFRPQNGRNVRLNSFDLGGWPLADYENQPIQILNGSLNVLADFSGTVRGAGFTHSHFDVGITSGEELRILFGNNFSIAIDNVIFDEALPVVSGVPEQGTLWLLASGLVPSALLRVRRALYRWTLLALMVGGAAITASADTIKITGVITQSTDDGTGPAMNNPSLNNIHDLQPFQVTLDFPGSITAPGMYNLTGSSLLFSVPSAGANESSFGSINLTVTSNGIFDDMSLLGCLTTGSDCFQGNQLTANFRILAAALNSQNVPAVGLDQPHPLDLLEDDGVTDIHGTISTYSYTGASPVPEPASLALCSLAAGVAALRRIRRQSNRKMIGR